MPHGERFNCLSHVFGLVLAGAAAIYLIPTTLQTGTTAQLIGASVFTLAAIWLYLASSLYHAAQEPIKTFWEKADHCAIYLFIAATVTPFLLTTTLSWASCLMLFVIWLCALAGIVMEVRSTRSGAPSLWIYLCMGWLGVMAVLLSWTQLNQLSALYLIIGAIAYTIGTYFYARSTTIKLAHGIWHMFVVAGTSNHFLAVLFHLR